MSKNNWRASGNKTNQRMNEYETTECFFIIFSDYDTQ